VRLGKDQKSLAREWAFKRLPDRNQFGCPALLDQFRGSLPGDDLYGGNGEQDLLAHHLPQARRRTADAHIGDFSEGVLLDTGELLCTMDH
jgi:hypothetical protein